MQIISRAEEIDRLIGMLKEGRRLVSIVGDCGAGKSAVATVVADRLMAKKFWHNAFYINLARVETVEAAAALICSAIGVPLFQSSPPCGEHKSLTLVQDALTNLWILSPLSTWSPSQLVYLN